MRYTVILEQESDGGFVASVPALPGCVSQGDTRSQAMSNIREAIDLYVRLCLYPLNLAIRSLCRPVKTP